MPPEIDEPMSVELEQPAESRKPVRLREVRYEILRTFGELLWGAAGLAFFFGGALVNSLLSKPFLPNPIFDLVLAGAFCILALLVNALADELEPFEDETEAWDEKPKTG